MYKYVKTIYDGTEVRVVFREGLDTHALNESSLLIRIRNGENAGMNMNVEKKGLKFLRVHDKYVPPKK